MKAPSPISELDNIIDSLNLLEDEDDSSAYDIRDHLFIFVKMLGGFDEYLQDINNIQFVHKNLIFNTGHIEKINKFVSGKENLLKIVFLIKKEIEFGKLKPKMLPKPKTITLAWLAKNSDFKFWVTVLSILSIVFSLGVVVEAEYKVGKNIVIWILSPSSQLQSASQEQIKIQKQKPQ